MARRRNGRWPIQIGDRPYWDERPGGGPRLTSLADLSREVKAKLKERLKATPDRWEALRVEWRRARSRYRRWRRRQVKKLKRARAREQSTRP